VVAAAVVNTRAFPGEDAEPWTPANAFPSTLTIEERELTETEDAEEQRRILRMYAAR